jgi:hypothetical protein
MPWTSRAAYVATALIMPGSRFESRPCYVPVGDLFWDSAFGSSPAPATYRVTTWAVPLRWFLTSGTTPGTMTSWGRGRAFGVVGLTDVQGRRIWDDGQRELITLLASLRARRSRRIGAALDFILGDRSLSPDGSRILPPLLDHPSYILAGERVERHGDPHRRPNHRKGNGALVGEVRMS